LSESHLAFILIYNLLLILFIFKKVMINYKIKCHIWVFVFKRLLDIKYIIKGFKLIIIRYLIIF